MIDLKKDNKFLPLLIALFGFFIFVFFTTSIYGDIQINIEDNNTKKEELKELDSKLIKLNKDKKDLENINNLQSKKIKKFTSNFSEDNIILYINNYIEQINNTRGEIVLALNSISFSDPIKSELGFKEIKINLKMKINNKFDLTNLLDYLITDTNEYGFFINNFSFPIEKSGPYKINIPLKMYIK